MNSLLAQTEGGMMVVFLKEDWEKRRLHGETSKSNWFLQEIKKVSPFVKFEIVHSSFAIYQTPLQIITSG